MHARTSILVVLLALGAPQLVWSAQTMASAPAATIAAPDATQVPGSSRLVACLSGLERFLPGSHYYCVGVHQQMDGKLARSIGTLKDAARWGSKPAQFLLGIGYVNGDTVAMDRAQGLAWLTLAAERGDAYNLAVLQLARQQASPAERERAHGLWQAILPEYADARAARRADQRYQRARRALVRDEVYGAKVCIAGLTTPRVTGPMSVEQNVASANTPLSKQASTSGPIPICGTAMPVGMVAKLVDSYAVMLFDGWSGHVTVGALDALPPAGK